ncbi:MAG: ATP-binding protein [Phycisphaerales bacterium]
MPRRTGSLAARALVRFASGMALILLIIVGGAWWLGLRALDDIRSELESRPPEVAGAVEPGASPAPGAPATPATTPAPVGGAGLEAAEYDLLMLRWLLVGGSLLAVGATVSFFWVILQRQVLTPLRQLRDTAERVGRGDLGARAQVRTGDELESFADAFNGMLDESERGRRQLTAMNQALDLKVGELSEANVGLGESNRLKSEFLANVSHELRTPLNSIIGFADLLEELARADPAADPKRVRYIQNIQRSGRSLLDMINELLDMAKIEAGRMEVTIAPTSVADLLEGLQTIMRPLAQQKRIEVELRTPADLPRVETDAGKLQQILYNFLSNAVKFSPEDGVIIVGAEPVERDGAVAALRVAVTDHGPGIPEDMQDTIFEKFRQVDASHTRRAGGTGLGLAICRELADLLGCTVGIVSKPGRGSTFWVEVPLVHKPKALKPLLPVA